MRHQEWVLRLDALIESRQHTRFAFGSHDCSLWACDVVQAVTERDPAADIRGYSTEQEAQSIMDANGGLAQMDCDRFGPEIAPICAAAGDVGLIETDRGPALVACVGLYWLGAGAFGLAQINPADVLRAWRCEVDPCQ